jgi:DNA adenine methylase
MSYQQALNLAGAGDMVYRDPAYRDTQAILYGAQSFRLDTLFSEIRDCKERGAHVALSIDGTKRSGSHAVDLPIPEGLFEREVLVTLGRSMLRRFQMGGQTLESEVVADRLLLTY